MQRVISALVIAAAVMGAPFAASAIDASSGAEALEVRAPHPEPVWYEWDSWKEEDRILNPAYVQTTAEIIIAASPRPVTSPKHWTCSAPRALANDASQTVRECEWR